VEGNNETDLIYYERADVPNPKLDAVCILKIQEGASLKTLLKRLLKTNVTVEKNREIYHYQGSEIRSKYRYVQIHLDNVKDLGFFLEFELKSSDRTVKKDKQVLRSLMNKFGIHSSQLVKWSYADLQKQAKKLEKATAKQT
jgi:predicted adenylyl cyclase CyaB